jgi:hypothetical protein
VKSYDVTRQIVQHRLSTSRVGVGSTWSGRSEKEPMDAEDEMHVADETGEDGEREHGSQPDRKKRKTIVPRERKK